MNPGLAEEFSTNKLLSSGTHQISFGKKSLKLTLSSSASKALAELDQHVDVELELYFSCLIRKRVNIRAHARDDAVITISINEYLSISFRPVMTKVCLVSDVDGEPDIESLPIVKPERYTPNWLSLKYKKGKFSGEFGY